MSSSHYLIMTFFIVLSYLNVCGSQLFSRDAVYCALVTSINSDLLGQYEWMYFKHDVNGSVYFNPTKNKYLYPMINNSDYIFFIGNTINSLSNADVNCHIGNPQPGYIFHIRDCFDNWSDNNLIIIDNQDICISGNYYSELDGTYTYWYFKDNINAAIYYNSAKGYYLYGLITNGQYQWAIASDHTSTVVASYCYIGLNLGADYLFNIDDCLDTLQSSIPKWQTYTTEWFIDVMSVQKCNYPTLSPTTLSPTTPSTVPTTAVPTTSTTSLPTSAPTAGSPTTAPTTLHPTLYPTTSITPLPTSFPTTSSPTLHPTLYPTTNLPTTDSPTTDLPTTISPTIHPIIYITPSPTTKTPTSNVPTLFINPQATTVATYTFITGNTTSLMTFTTMSNNAIISISPISTNDGYIYIGLMGVVILLLLIIIIILIYIWKKKKRMAKVQIEQTNTIQRITSVSNIAELNGRNDANNDGNDSDDDIYDDNVNYLSTVGMITIGSVNSTNSSIPDKCIQKNNEFIDEYHDKSDQSRDSDVDSLIHDETITTGGTTAGISTLALDTTVEGC